MESLAAPIVALAILMFGLVIAWKMIMPRGIASHVLAEVIHDIIQGVWHFILGPRRVHFVRRRSRWRRW